MSDRKRAFEGNGESSAAKKLKRSVSNTKFTSLTNILSSFSDAVSCLPFSIHKGECTPNRDFDCVYNPLCRLRQRPMDSVVVER